MDSDINPAHEAELHAAWRSGDRGAATKLIVRYRPRLRSLGEQLGLSDVEAEDLAQQVLLEAPGSVFEPRDGSNYFNWLSAIARRKAFRMSEAATVRSSIRRVTTPWTARWRSEVYESIESMPPPVRDIFVRLAVGYTPHEIGQELGLSASTVRTRIFRGRQWLRDRGH